MKLDALLEAIDEIRREQELELNEFRDRFTNNINMYPFMYEHATKEQFAELWKWQNR